MKMKKSAILIASLVFALSSQGSVILELEKSGFMDENNIVSNNMVWGLVVDTNNSSGPTFSDLTTGLDPFVLPSAGGNVQLSINSTLSDLYFYLDPANVVTTNSGPPSFSDGYMFTMQLDMVLAAPGNSYYLAWFPDQNAVGQSVSGGNPVGLQNPGLTLPSDGSTVNISASISPDSADYTVVPEPNTWLLAAVGLTLAITFRRRRARA
jgi:hypothetical protein